jgi:drug/metabolite transporter (DMT)-like permease
MNWIKASAFSLLAVFGVFLVVYGGYDDSPGGQLLGLAAVIGGIVGVYKSARKKLN